MTSKVDPGPPPARGTPVYWTMKRVPSLQEVASRAAPKSRSSQKGARRFSGTRKFPPGSVSGFWKELRELVKLSQPFVQTLTVVKAFP